MSIEIRLSKKEELHQLEQIEEVSFSVNGKYFENGVIPPLPEEARIEVAYNFSSQHLCEKLGMRREGIFMEFVSFINDTEGNPIYENTIQYAILKKEWNR